MIISHITVYRYSIPMVPFTIATGTMDFAQNILVHIHTQAGLHGVGECSAFPMIVGENQDTCFVLAESFGRLWKGKDASEIEARLAELDYFIAGNHTIKSAFDMALYDLAAKQAGMPLYQFLGGRYFEPESDLTIGINPAAQMAEQALDFVKNRDVKMLKVKLGKSAPADIERIRKIREAVGEDVVIRIDANQGWDFETAQTALDGMEPYDIQFCEQPMPKWLDKKLPLLRKQTRIPLMADESVFDHRDAIRLIEADACDFINIKLCKAGGIREALKIHKVCVAAGIPNMLGGMLESRVALSAKLHLALACNNIRFYDLDTCLLGHLEDPVVHGVKFRGMKLCLPDLPGIGADADPAFLRECGQVTV